MANTPPMSTEGNNNRSDPSRTYNIDSKYLARLRPETLDDTAIKSQISIIQQACNDINIDADSIALLFHECDYNLQNTITRIKSGDFTDGGWQTAKPNNKKKNNHNSNAGDPTMNGGHQSDSERSHSQRTSPTPSLRGGAGGYRRYEHSQHQGSMGTSAQQQHYHHSSRGSRRGNDSGRNHFGPSNARFPRQYSYNKLVPSPTTTSSQQLPAETVPIETPAVKQQEQPVNEIAQASSPSPDEFEFVGGNPHSLTFDNSLKKTMPLPPSHLHSKRPIPSTIPQEPVSMHPSVQHSNKPLDIQFGDVQWDDSVPRAISPSNIDESDNYEHRQGLSQASPIAINVDHGLHSVVQDDLTSNYCNHHTTNDSDTQLLETTHPLSSSSISSSLAATSNNLANTLAAASLDGTSHLSDHLTESTSPVIGQYPHQQHEQLPGSLPMILSSSSIANTSRLPPTSTPRGSDLTPPLSHGINQYQSGGLQPSLSGTSNGGGPSAFTPLANHTNYNPMPRDYSHVPQHWTQHPQQPSTYKMSYKQQTGQTGNYPQQTSIQQSQQYPTAQQHPILVGHYPYTFQPMLHMIAPIDSWSTTGFPSALEPYQTYPQTSYIPAYPNQQYHPANIQLAKPDQVVFDKEYFANYGQARTSNTDLSYQQQQQPLPPSSSSSQQAQSNKDPHVASKLSPNAATFSQGAPLTAAGPAHAYFWNPVSYPVPAYFPSAAASTPSYAPIDTRDNRNGASYGGGNRNHYHHHGQQQRSHNNASSSTWHSQQ